MSNVVFKTSTTKTINDLLTWDKSDNTFTAKTQVVPGTIYFTSDGHILYDTDNNTRLWMSKEAYSAIYAQNIDDLNNDIDSLFVKKTGDTVTGTLNLNGNVYLNNETYAQDITTNTLLVQGNTSFVNIPIAPTATTGTNDTQLATTAFVYNIADALQINWDNINKKIVFLKNNTANDIMSFNEGAGISLSATENILTIINNASATILGTPGAGKTITSFSQLNGNVSATFTDISIASSQITSGTISSARLPEASTSQYGIVKLCNNVNSDSQTDVATANAVKTAYDSAIATKYWADITITNTQTYNTAPEVAKIKLNGNTTATQASTNNAEIIYDNNTKTLNFIFN